MKHFHLTLCGIVTLLLFTCTQQVNAQITCTATANFSYQTFGGGRVQFTNSSSSSYGLNSSWTFNNSGGGIGTSTLTNPQFTYTGQPPYNATLIITDSTGGCSDTITQIVNIPTICITLQTGAGKAIIDQLDQDFPTTNEGNADNLFASQWTVNGVPTEFRGLLQFNLSQIPVGSTITSANLSLYADTTSSNGYADEPTYGNNNASYLEQVTSAWGQYITTWNTQPAATTTNQVLLPQSVNYAENYTNLNISDFVQSWVNNPSQNYGMLLKMITQNHYNSMIFCSSFYSDSTLWPALSICYIPACNTHAAFSYQALGGGLVQFTNSSTSTNGYNSNWTFYNAGGAIGNSARQNPQYTYTGQPPYSATLIVNDSVSGCTDTVTQSLNLTTCITLQTGAGKSISDELPGDDPTVNEGNSTQLLASQWTVNLNPIETRGLLQFNISQVPVGSTIISANLNLYADTNNIDNGYYDEPTYGSNNACYLEQVTTAWSQYTATWNTQPAVTTTNEVLLPQSISYTENYTNLNLSNFVQSWVNDPSKNYGMLLKMITQNHYNSMIFCTSYYPDSTLWPALNICYIPPVQCNTHATFSYQNFGNGLVQFTNTSASTYGYNSEWIFYNGSGVAGTNSLNNPQFTYAGQPPYTATLIIRDSLLPCSDTITAIISVNNCITIKAGPTQTITAEVSSYSPNTPAPSLQDFMSEQWTFNGTPGKGKGLIKFDLSAIPPGSVINSATLNLTANINSSNGYNGTPTYGNNNAAYLEQVTSSWNLNTVTWNTQPTTTATGAMLLPQSTSTAENYTVDVAAFVQNWVSNPSQNNGMLLEPIGTTFYNSLIFCSSSYPDSTRWPSLNICFSTNPSACSSVFSYATSSDSVWFTNQSPANDSVVKWTFGDGDSSAAINPIHIYNQNGGYVVTLTVADSTGSCIDTALVYVYGNVNDTLCGLVWNDLNSNGILDYGEQTIPYAPVIINGITHDCDATGHFLVTVAGGNQAISVILPTGWGQTFPLNPSEYLIPTTNNQTICGVDFGIVDSAATGISTLSEAASNGMFIYPNPASGLGFNIRVSPDVDVQNTVIIVYDMTGREIPLTVIQRQTGLFTVSLDADAASGVYMVALKNGDQQMYGKVFVAR